MGKRLAGEALRKSCLAVAAIAALGSAPAEGWGDLGHKVSAIVAYRHLTPQARGTGLAAATVDDANGGIGLFHGGHSLTEGLGAVRRG